MFPPSILNIPTVDSVKIRVRSHDPEKIWEKELFTIDDAICYLVSIKQITRKPGDGTWGKIDGKCL